jgi:putative transposase
MPTKRLKLSNNEIYHIVVRGIEGRNIFSNERDYSRAIRNFFEFNDSHAVSWSFRRENVSRTEFEKRSRTTTTERDLLVEVLAFCLMPNHIHLLLKQIKDGGISKFMRKFGAGYVGYFNRKYERQGHLFQGRFRAVHIKTDNQLRSVFVYIHTNPAALIDPNWKEGGIGNPEKIIKFIGNYKWSSYQDYLGKDNFSSVTHRDLFEKMMSREKWQKFINEWVEYKSFRGWDKSVELE